VFQEIRPAPPPAAAAPAPDPDAAAKALAAAIAEMVNTVGAAVYFDYDKSDLRDDAKATLDAKVPILQANKQVRVRIAGNTDELGSDEYNLALGQRRAAAAKAYLVARGIDASRIDIVSFGEERPAQPGSDDASRAKNRRDEIEIVAGRETMQPVRR
jgi:peptidoglycan-associated lipoprotein